jgi:membrane associated rhomboid family serine protease
LLVFLLWLIYSVKDGTQIAGFESIWPGDTSLTLYSECEDYRDQIWRWWSYQFTHTSFTHVFTNVLLVLVLGIQLEGYHGTLHLLIFFQIGVFGGAMCYLVSDCHVSTVGMSGGCYSLIGMHIGDIALNWQERPRRWAKLLLILFFFAFDTLQTYVLSSSDDVSHSAHTGGFVAGIVICVIWGHNSKVHDYERVIQVLALLIGIGCTSFCLGWGLQWPPQTIFEEVPWCWTRQVKNKVLFGDWDARCVRCDNQECIDKWSQEQYIATVTVAACESIGGWAVTER